MDFKDHWNTVYVEMNRWNTLNEDGLLYTDGLGPCIGLCLAFGHWAGIIHSSHPPHDKKEIGEFIAAAKTVIPHQRLKEIQPVLCGSDPECDLDLDDNPTEYETERLLARKTIIEILKEEGFGEPKQLWSEATETAAVFADLKRLKVFVETGGRNYEYTIPQ